MIFSAKRWRGGVARWLAVKRHLDLKDPGAEPQPTTAQFVFLGHRVTRDGISLGPKARARMRTKLVGHLTQPDRLEQAVGSYAALWMWGA